MDQYLLQHPHDIGGLPEKNWETLKKCIVKVSEKCIGRKSKKQPDRFHDAIDNMPLVTAKRNAYCRLLQTRATQDIRR